MAGIGFRLHKLLKGESYSDLVKAYLFSAIITTGPMLVTIAFLAFVGQFLKKQLSPEQGELLLGLILYAYAFSMIVMGIFLYIVSRYLADLEYLKKIELFTPTYLSVLEITLSLQAIIACIYLYPLPLETTVKWSLFCLYLSISGIWLAMTFLSAAKSYLWIVAAFVIGSFAGGLSSWFCGKTIGFAGYLSGFMIGQATIFFLLSARIFREFGYQKSHDFSFLSHMKKYPYLTWVGLLYYIAVWIDKFIFWFSPHGDKLGEHLYVFLDYDLPMFLAFMTIVPSMAFFLVQMETSFARHFRAYYEAVRRREPLTQLQEKLEGVRLILTRQFQKYVLFQGLLSGVIILFLYQIAEAFQLNPAQMGVLRIAILGAFLQMGFLMVLTILFYFDAQKECCLLTLFFLVCNALLTALTLKIGLPAYGFGYAGSCFISLIAGFFVLDHRVKNLHYWTFMKQPILLPHFQLETESFKK
ncbi:MAG: exopolysaccharide Pel transporter PelG [Deltaproteobacteria bacterium]|nr:exopolysaccharide Pel transporter PelG [Deltaproteobacteria bacterium]